MQTAAGATEIAVLCATAVAIGAGHTILGPDHYLPFVAMARAGRWSAARTAAVTAACGLGHVAGSVVIGMAAIAAGVALERVEGLEGLRGDTAAWLLVGVGLAYAAWGLVRASRGGAHAHVHAHADGTVHAHPHAHHGEHLHVHAPEASAGAIRSAWGPWALFLVFLFGPCEPLIPLLMYPAATLGPGAVVAVATAFAVATVATMVGAVFALRAGFGLVRVPGLERYGDALAGLAVAVCGGLVVAGL